MREIAIKNMGEWNWDGVQCDAEFERRMEEWPATKIIESVEPIGKTTGTKPILSQYQCDHGLNFSEIIGGLIKNTILFLNILRTGSLLRNTRK